jgi:hypothetical protein
MLVLAARAPAVGAPTSGWLAAAGAASAEISATPDDLGALAVMEAGGGEFVFTEITTDYWEQMNGLRFPGQVTIVRNRYRITANAIRPYQTLPQVEVTQTYIDYDFLAIPTEEQIRRLIFGAGQ